MMAVIRKISIPLLVVLLSTTTATARPTAKITVKAVDEQGIAIEGAVVHVGFEIPNNTGIGTTETRKTGITDKNGEFVASADSMNTLGFSVDKEGYYQSGRGYEFKSSSLLLNRWEPWNPTIEVVLKKKRNPVAMYDNHRTTYKVPLLDTPIGYDLEKEDWVAPYGSGLIADLIVTFNAAIRAYADYDCSFSIRFSNPNDGIQEFIFDPKDQSSFKWPYEAQISGYLHEISKQKNMNLNTTGYKSNEKENANYIFRVRTKVDKKGNIVDARYGKISGEFGFVPKGAITFRYLLNPDGTRNLEEDPNKNLFKKK